jgi:hypothetical protein
MTIITIISPLVLVRRGIDTVMGRSIRTMERMGRSLHAVRLHVSLRIVSRRRRSVHIHWI